MKPDWKTALITLEDSHFFDLVRNYLGDIRSPYNKQKLVEELGAWILREEHQNVLLSYLDENDRRILSAIHELRDPSLEGLSIYLSLDLPFAALNSALVNLEERLIIYRYKDEGIKHIAINPLLSDSLSAVLKDRSVLFPSRPIMPDEILKADNEQSLSLHTLAAAACWLDGKSEIYKLDGGLKKKTREELESFLPAHAIHDLLSILISWKAVTERNGIWQIDVSAFSGLESLNERDLLFYVAASLTLSSLNMDSSSRARYSMRALAQVLKQLISEMSMHRAYPPQTLQRMFTTIEKRSGLNILSELQRRYTDPTGQLLNSLLRTAFLISLEDGYYALNVPQACDDEEADGHKPLPLGIDATFSIIGHHSLSFMQAIKISRFLSIREAGTVLRWELTREAVVRGFDQGISPNDMKTLLEALSGRTLPQNLAWSLADWYKRYTSITLHRGIVVVVSEDRRHLLETPEFQALVLKELAPGVLLLDCSSEEDARNALLRAGADIIAQPVFKEKKYARDTRLALFQSIPESSDEFPPLPTSAPCVKIEDIEDTVSKHLDRLRQVLDHKKLPKDQREELLARIERRIILDESQLVGSSVRYEKLEAKGLDYVGKVRVAEQAHAQQALVEVHWRGPGGTPNVLLGACVSLNKSGQEIEIRIDPVMFGNQVSIPIGKISLIRRVKRSIFGD